MRPLLIHKFEKNTHLEEIDFVEVLKETNQLNSVYSEIKYKNTLVLSSQQDGKST